MGNDQVITANMMGNIQSIMRCVLCCRGSMVGIVAIFCWTHMDPPTRIVTTKLTGLTRLPTKAARSTVRNMLSMGMLWWTAGSHA